MAPLTFADLRHLVRLRREWVDGAEQQLAHIIATRAEELPEIIGFPASNLDRLHAAADPVALLAGTVEGAPKLWRDQRAKASRTAASSFAERLATTAQYDGDRVVLDVALLARTVAIWPGNGSIAFGGRGFSDVGTVRALLRECRKVDAISAVISGSKLVVMYETAVSRGHVALVLDGHIEHQDVLVVPLQVPPQTDLVQNPPQPVVQPSHDDRAQPPQVLRHPIRSPRPPSRPSAGFFVHLVNAAVDALAGGLR